MKNLFFALAFVLLFSGCVTNNTYPDIPTLEFKSLTFGEQGAYTFTLIATFTDGDGDIGYYQDRPNEPIFDDEQSPYYYNFVIGLQVKKNGIWMDSVIVYREIDYKSDTTEADNDTTYTPYNNLISERIPYITQDGQNKGLKGDIDKSAFLPVPFTGDSIRYRAFIYDRALHKSNEIFTPGYFVRTP